MIWKLFYVFFALVSISLSTADEMELYNTKRATSDLLWAMHSTASDGGWEEVSSFDRDHETTIRSYQVCHPEEADSDNWIRSPYISGRKGNRIHLDVEFFITKCSSPSENKNSKCKETFNIFYYEADKDVASSTFPPWQEDPFVKIDTVAANAADGIDKKTFSFGPLTREGFYIAIQDLGACMSLLAIKVYYFYCHEVTKNLAMFPKTISGVESASLVTVSGKCVHNSRVSSEDEPQYHCNSNGQWQIPTGECQCLAGYQTNLLGSNCTACPAGTYKLQDGSQMCTPCPSNSGLSKVSSSMSKVERMLPSNNQCPCHPGFARAKDEDISVPCTKPPSKPQGLEIVKVNTTSAKLTWSVPTETGGRADIYYRLKCESTGVDLSPKWKSCSRQVTHIAPSRGGKFYQTSVKMFHLIPYRKYRITVYALNGASSEQYPSSSGSVIQFRTDEGVPSPVTDVKVSYRPNLPAKLEWALPVHPNGKLLGYEVELQPKVTPGSSPRPSVPAVAPSVIETKVNFIELSGFEKDVDYLVRVRAKTSAGYGPYSAQTSFHTSPADSEPLSNTESSLPVWVIAAAIAGVLLIFIVIMVWRYRSTGKLFCLNTSGMGEKKKASIENATRDHALQERLIVDLPPPGQRIYVDYPDPQAAIARMGRELNPNDIKIEEIIGTGEFAEVCKATMYSGSQYVDVAVKRLKRGATQKDENNFLREATTMAQFNDPNVVQLIGVVTKNHLGMIVSEYMEHRSLDRYLNLNKDQFSVIQLTSMLRGVASGMRYLSGMKYVHRDLAARNILVNSDNVCKVSDFGLSRTLENDPHATYTTQGGKIAIRWTALECILYRKFTSASDVWSFGIVMWEVMSYGEKPYWDMSNDDVINNVQSGMRLPSPVNCPKPLHDIMVDCWLADSSARPTFSQLVAILDSLLQLPQQLVPEGAAANNSVFDAREIATPNLGRAMDNGEVDSVEKWLELQRLSKYREQFSERGIDNLEKVSNLTINDLKALGIDVTLHINKLENGIRTLKRHLSCSSTPPSSTRTSNASTLQDQEERLTMTVDPNGSLLV